MKDSQRLNVMFWRINSKNLDKNISASKHWIIEAQDYTTEKGFDFSYTFPLTFCLETLLE